jgi:hypothetical protein
LFFVFVFCLQFYKTKEKNLFTNRKSLHVEKNLKRKIIDFLGGEFSYYLLICGAIRKISHQVGQLPLLLIAAVSALVFLLLLLLSL